MSLCCVSWHSLYKSTIAQRIQVKQPSNAFHCTIVIQCLMLDRYVDVQPQYDTEGLSGARDDLPSVDWWQ